MKRSSRIIGAAGVAASLALVTWVGYGLLAGRSQSPASSDPDSLPTSDTAEITKASFDITTVATGELEAKKQIEIRSRVEQQAVIQEVIAEGTKVKEGDVLVRLNADRIQTAIAGLGLVTLLEIVCRSRLEADPSYSALGPTRFRATAGTLAAALVP